MASEKCKKAACPTVCSIIGLCLIIAATTIIALGTVEKLVKMMVNSVSDIIKKITQFLICFSMKFLESKIKV